MIKYFEIAVFRGKEDRGQVYGPMEYWNLGCQYLKTCIIGNEHINRVEIKFYDEDWKLLEFDEKVL